MLLKLNQDRLSELWSSLRRDRSGTSCFRLVLFETNDTAVKAQSGKLRLQNMRKQLSGKRVDLRISIYYFASNTFQARQTVWLWENTGDCLFLRRARCITTRNLSALRHCIKIGFLSV